MCAVGLVQTPPVADDVCARLCRISNEKALLMAFERVDASDSGLIHGKLRSRWPALMDVAQDRRGHFETWNAAATPFSPRGIAF